MVIYTATIPGLAAIDMEESLTERAHGTGARPADVAAWHVFKTARWASRGRGASVTLTTADPHAWDVLVDEMTYRWEINGGNGNPYGVERDDLPNYAKVRRACRIAVTRMKAAKAASATGEAEGSAGMADTARIEGQGNLTRGGAASKPVIFYKVSRWAYREMRHHFGDEDGFFEAIRGRVDEVNATYTQPLRDCDVRSITKSIHRWITTESNMWRDGPEAYEANFRAIQSARARRPRPGAAGKPRPEWHTQLLAEHVDVAPTAQDAALPTAKAPYRRNITARAAAEKYGQHPRSIRRVAAQPREEYEAEAQARQDAALHLREQGLTHAQIGVRLGVSGNAAAGLVRRALTRKKQAEKDGGETVKVVTVAECGWCRQEVPVGVRFADQGDALVGVSVDLDAFEDHVDECSARKTSG